MRPWGKSYCAVEHFNCTSSHAIKNTYANINLTQKDFPESCIKSRTYTDCTPNVAVGIKQVWVVRTQTRTTQPEVTTPYNYSGTSPYGHLTSKVTSPLRSPSLSLKLYSSVQCTPCNTVTCPLRSLLPSPAGDLISEVPL